MYLVQPRIRSLGRGHGKSRWLVDLPRPRRRREYNPNWRDFDPEYAPIRDAHVAAHPFCQARSPLCSGRREVHHIAPVHLFPELRLDPRNLITLCEFHHYYLGHTGDWWAWNPRVVAMAVESQREKWTASDLLRRVARERIYHRLPYRGRIGTLGGTTSTRSAPVSSPPSSVSPCSFWWARLYRTVRLALSKPVLYIGPAKP